jgi:hypothetical protein
MPIDKHILEVMRRARNNYHQKNKRTFQGIGTPTQNDGNNGDIRLQSTQTGVKLYAKHEGKWYSFTPDDVGGINSNLTVDDGGFIANTGTANFGNGLILKWGYESTTGTSQNITFPTPFEHKCFTVFLVGHDSGNTGGSANSPELKSLATKTGFSISMASATDTVYWLAIGN